MPRRTLIPAFLLALTAFAQSPDRAASLASFELIWSTVRDHNPDTKFHGLDWQATHDTFRPRIEKAKSQEEVRSILREMLAGLGVSHYSVIPAGMYAPTADAPTPSATPAPAQPAGPQQSAPEATPQSKPATSKPATSKPAPVITETPPEPPPTTTTFGNLPAIRTEFESRTLPDGAGYIRFNEFLDPVTFIPRFSAALREFAHAPGIVLDVRGNRGGIAIMATGVAGFFVKERGQFGEMKMRDTVLRFAVFPRAETYDGPLAILIDEGSASTAEIFAQGMRDLHRARLFGTRTAGAALPSDIIRLPDGDGFQYPTASYTSTNGRVLEGNGVLPDVEVHDHVIEAAAQWIKEQSR